MIPPLPTDIFHQGQVLNNTYEIEGVIGRGGTGEVYRARNLVSGRIVAVKVLSRQFSGNEDYIELMRREEQMRDIADDAVVRYTECSRSDDGYVFLVMDFIDGPSLQDELRRRRFDPRELLIVAHRVAEGLDAAHRRGIVHRDLSPDNIILREGDVEKATIIDFGIAKDTTAGARTIVGNDFAGKYEYAAPEQLEGRADSRSDLYALGASLLAAWRGEVPFSGSTPGEIVRRKREPLDTSGVPEPLKALIERLAAPAPSARPSSAAEALGAIEAALAVGKPRSPRRGAAGAGRSARRRTDRTMGVAAMLVAFLLVATAGGLWYAGLLDRFLAAEVPVASPYRLSASTAGEPKLSGDAPDPDSATMLRRAFGTVSGVMPPESALTLARGAPSDTWAAALADLIGATVGLQDWTMEVEDRDVHLSGLAPDAPTRDRLAADLSKRAEEAGLTLDLDLAAGPRVLSADALSEVLDRVATCGPLTLVDPPREGYGLGDTVRAAGSVASPDDEDRLRQALVDIVGDRSVALEATVLSEDLCTIQKLLPQAPSQGMSIRFAEGATGETNLSGVFNVGANPVVDVDLPATITEGWIWVVLVDNTDEVFNLLPNIDATEHRVSQVGQVDNGIRRIRVMHSGAEIREDRRRLGFVISEGNFGKSEIIAFLTREPLFPIRRPRDESIESFSEGLSEALAERPGNIIAVASRVLEARP